MDTDVLEKRGWGIPKRMFIFCVDVSMAVHAAHALLQLFNVVDRCFYLNQFAYFTDTANSPSKRSQEALQVLPLSLRQP